VNNQATSPATADLTALTACVAGFVRSPFMRGAFFMRGAAALAGNLALFLG
jgi:hypothetical protein